MERSVRGDDLFVPMCSTRSSGSSKPRRRRAARPSPPEITALDRYQLVRNDDAAAARLRRAFQAHFDDERVVDIPPISASEEFGSFGSEWHAPAVFWTVGGTDPDVYGRAHGFHGRRR